MASLALVWDLIARDNASPAFAKVGAAAESTAAKTDAAASKVGGGMATMAKAAGLAGVVFAGAAVKMAADFQSSTVRLVTSANESQKNLKMVQQGMLDLAGAAGYGTDELSKAMYKVESGGQHGAAALATLKAAAQGAKTENADLTTVADALTSAMTDYHLKASDAADVTSKLVAATASGKMTFEELAGSLAAILPVASANHVALNDILGDLASMTMHGMSAEQASQNLADAIRHLAAPTQQQQKEFAALGLTAQQITADLGTKGLSGTINVIGDAIKAQMGADSSQVVLNLGTALSKLPEPVRKLGESILDGSISLGDYRKAMKALPAEQAIAAQSFMGLVSSTHQIGNETKNGAEIYQSYSGALRQALGDATGMNVALMIGGENAGNTATAIANVSKATAEAGHNVKGWSEIQGTFNQQASETLHSLEAMTISVGMHLLPALTAGMGYINRDAIPALKGLGSGIGDAVHWFSELPAPVKAAAEAMAALKIAELVGLTGKLGAGLTVARTAIATFAASASTGAGALAAAKSAGTGLMSLVGGPWVIGIGALTAAYVASSREIDNWAKGLEQGGREAAIATSQLNAAHTRSLADATSVSDAWDITKGAFADGLSQIKGYSSALDEAAHKSKDWYDHLSASQRIDENLKVATDNLNEAIAQSGSKSDAAKFATFEYNQALGDQKTAQQNLDIATRGANGALQTRISLEQQLAQGGVDFDQANLSAKQSIDDYKKSLKDANLTEDARQQLLDGVSQSLFNVMDAAKRKADAETTGLPQSIITNQEIVRQRDALNAVVQQLGFVPPALQGMYDSLNGPTAAALQAAKTNVDNLGTGMTTVTTTDVPGMMKALNDLAAAAGSTFPQAVTGGFLPAAKGAGDAITQTGGLADVNGQKVSMFGQIISGLPPSHNTNITADTTAAQKTIDDFLANVKAKGFVGAVFNVGSPVGSGAQTGGLIGVPPVHKATGGAISGPGTGTSDSVLIAASNGEHMWTAAETAAAGGHAGVEALRKAVLAGGGGRAGGGPIYPVDFSKSVQDGWAASLSKATTFTGGGGGAGSPLIRVLGQNIANAMGFGGQFPAIDFVFSHESGWNPNAQNPTSSAYGIPQFLSSTWAQYGGKTSDPATQIRDGIRYMVDRYGSPNGAASFWQGHHWYDGGGYLMPGVTMAYNGTGKPERIRTAEQESALSGSPMQVTLQLDRDAVTDLLDGRIVSAFTTATNRGQHN